MVWNFGSVSMLVCVVYIIVSDIYLALNGRVGDTYSEMFALLSTRYVVIPCAWGAINGHWFLPLGIVSPWWGLFLLLGVGGVLFAADVLTGNWLADHTHPGAWLLIGLALGAVFWSQSPKSHDVEATQDGIEITEPGGSDSGAAR